ncbi:glycosyltransferase family 2 protein [Bartonella sp. LJL80]
MTKIAIISPVYNEGSSINSFIKRVDEVFARSSYEVRIVLVDDGSVDDSWFHLKNAIASDCEITSIRLAKNFGKEAAIAAGLSVADADVVITIDSDLQHPPELILEMLKKWEEGAEIVVAVKEERQEESFFSRLAAQSFYRIFRWITENDIQGSSDFILLDRKVVKALRALPEKLFFYRGVVHWLGYKQTSVSFTPANRLVGVSGWSFWKKVRLAIDSLTGFSAKPLMLIWALTLVFIIFAALVGGDAVISKFLGKAVSGFSTLILVVLITGIAILSSFCLLTVYVRQIFYEVKARPRYFISEKSGVGDEETQSIEEKAS